MKKILVVDDDLGIRDAFTRILKKQKYEVITADSGEQAIAMVEKDLPDLILLDIKMPGMDGLEALQKIKNIDKQLTVIVMTAYGTMHTAVKAMKEGAYDYITKPVNPDHLKILVEKALEMKVLADEVDHLRAELVERCEIGAIVGNTVEMQNIYKIIGRVAAKNITVLISGESGTGKELVAKAIHAHSPRKDGSFVPVDCASLSPTVLESELFGHEKGAFTGATYKRIGRFEQADGGTLFLDEVGNFSLETQAKLLRFLQEKEFQRIGGSEVKKVDVRIIAATNKDLGKAVAEGYFREDLYHRLNVVPIVLPELRKRKGDIPLLVSHFLQKATLGYRERAKRVSPEAVDLLMRHDWPGNVRELENAINRAIVISKGDVILPEDLPLDVRGAGKEMEPAIADQELSFDEAVANFERKLIVDALNKTGWVQTRAAKLLGISRKVLEYRMKRYRLDKGKINN